MPTESDPPPQTTKATKLESETTMMTETDSDFFETQGKKREF